MIISVGYRVNSKKNYDYRTLGIEQTIPLVALTLMIAESRMKEKTVMVKQEF